MPEYLTPGVYLEETSFRSRSIEGVATSTLGLVGTTSYGPLPYVVTPAGSKPVVMVPGAVLVTSFTEFERAFGGLDPVGILEDQTNYLAYAARAFFGNGGRRLYVSRVFPFAPAVAPAPGIIATGIDPVTNFAQLDVGTPAVGHWRARWPGAAANRFSVQVSIQRSKNILVGGLKGVSPGAAVEEFPDRTKIIDIDPATRKQVPPAVAKVKIIARDDTGKLGYRKTAGPGVDAVIDDNLLGVCHLTFTVTVRWGDRRQDVYPGLELDDVHPRAISRVLQAVDPNDEFALVWLDLGVAPPPAADLITGLLTLAEPQFLSGAVDSQPLIADVITGEVADPDNAARAATGLAALAEVEDIAIVASPDVVRFDANGRKTGVDALISHCQAHKAYRIGIVDPPKDSSLSEVRSFRSQFDTTYTALYYPWVEIVDPTAKADPGAAPATLALPPSGFVAGIYARSDINRGVHKAPANEVVLGITRFLATITDDRQAVLNPEGINALRFFEGRANRVWGARTMSSDPEWKYVNVRRLFNYLEHSIDKSTQWAVFEPNNERLWASIRQTITDFLTVVWQTGALMGTNPDEAFFVRCDRSTMAQNDLDNGRLICQIGVAPTYPAEFVVFRIGQWTADAQQN